MGRPRNDSPKTAEAARKAKLRTQLRGRILDRTGLSLEGWLMVRFNQPYRGYMGRILARHLCKEAYPKETSKAYRVIKALEKETGLKLCG